MSRSDPDTTKSNGFKRVAASASAFAMLAALTTAEPLGAAPIPPPTVSSVCRLNVAKPACEIGSTAGGYDVHIDGYNLLHASRVSFGSIPATSFTVDSATQITAVVPASNMWPWPASGVSVTVTTPGGTSPTCAVLQAGCSSGVFFYGAGVSLAGSGTNVSHFFDGSIGGVTYGGHVTIGSWSTSGSVQSSGNFVPEAVLAYGNLTVKNVTIKLTVSGSINTEEDIPIPLPGLPSIAALYLRIIPNVTGTVSITDSITADSISPTVGWVNGIAHRDGSGRSCGAWGYRLVQRGS